ncbi:MAG: tetratricopeptide repeat protein [Desulfobacteraceae bacterium]|nr:tetratricopeptide repeat protein [Desulfobacteraceae bacterium]
MLRYTVEGIADPERQEIYNHLVTDIFQLSDEIFLSLYSRLGEGLFFEALRKHQEDADSALSENMEKYRHEMDRSLLMADEEVPSDAMNEGVREIFELLLTQSQLYKTEAPTITHIFTEGSLPWPQQSLLVSAVTVHLLHHFNEQAILLLFKLMAHPNQEVCQRALVGLFLVMYKYDERLPLYPQIGKQLNRLKEKHAHSDALRNIVIQIMRTSETEKLARKLTDEILPEVARIHPNLRDRLDLDNIIGDGFKEGKNPDWEDIFSDSPELMGKLEEFSRLQMEGADLFLSTFRMLKQFPFFNHTENWFMPFPWPNPIVDDILKNESGPFKNPDLIKGMAQSGILCNSDKYSLILSIPQMPAAQKEMMGQMFMAEMGAINEIEKSDELIDADKKALAISNQYIQDLYRFFRVHPRRSDFQDPFATPLDFHNCHFIEELFPDEDFLRKLGAYLFEKDRFKEALEAFTNLSKKTSLSMQILQKQAFCHQQINRYDQALDLYLQADLFDHSQVWNLKKIALCYRYLKNPEKALEYYLEAEKTAPDNLHTQVSIGHCLLELKNYEQALKYYFKVEYLDPGNQKVWRPIVWCALALGKFDQAEKYSHKLLDKKPTQHDYMNMGHITWCQSNRQAALEWYQRCVTFPGHSFKAFLESFNNDKEMLINHKVEETDIPIMLDQLRYYLQ